jgi:hypothetical protein
MKIKKSYSFLMVITIIFCFGSLFTSCKNNSMEGFIVVTQTKDDLKKVNYNNGSHWRFLPQSRIVAFDPNKSNRPIKKLTDAFYSACSPQISYDGKFMVFTAQKTKNDIWQIWEMNLENLKVRQVISSIENCIDPSYLPDNRLVFSKFIENDTVIKAFPLFTCNMDGSNLMQITYNPHAYFAPTVLHDGRVLTISKQLYPDQRNGVFMVLRPDGTKQELFYRALKSNHLHSRAYESGKGKIVFVESKNNTKKKGNIICIDYNRPLHSRINLTSEIKGDFYSASPLFDSRLLVSYRSSNNGHYALYEFDTEMKSLGHVIYENKDYNLLDAVEIKIQERPKKLPSEVNMKSKTGLLLCQDINFGKVSVEKKSASKAVSVELTGIDQSFGRVDVEQDGSFYLKILADVPFRIQTIDSSGNVVGGPSTWMYLRPNERHGCVGCHADNEQVPENRQPLAVKKNPIEIQRAAIELGKNKISLK